jgi:hypothetical protein
MEPEVSTSKITGQRFSGFSTNSGCPTIIDGSDDGGNKKPKHRKLPPLAF